MKDSVAIGGGVLIVAFWLFVIGCWGVNGYKLTKCDFDAPYKCEGVHAVGLVGPMAVFTVWYDGK